MGDNYNLNAKDKDNERADFLNTVTTLTSLSAQIVNLDGAIAGSTASNAVENNTLHDWQVEQLNNFAKPIVDKVNQTLNEMKTDIANGASVVSRGSGIVGAAATSASAVPGPHESITLPLATGASLVEFGATLVEQVMRPNIGSYVVGGGVDIAVGAVANKFPLWSPVLNEGAELVKNSDLTRAVEERIGK